MKIVMLIGPIGIAKKSLMVMNAIGTRANDRINDHIARSMREIGS